MTRSRLTTAGVVFVALVIAGVVSARVGRGAWGEIRREMPGVVGSDLEEAAGAGFTLALLGGFRAVIADFLWLRANAVWEVQDLPATQASIRLVTTVDPRPLPFWLNGARMIGYDMPVWRIEKIAARGGPVPRAVEMRIVEEQVHAALALLERATRHHPGEPLILIEMANLRLRKLGDVSGAARLYHEAAVEPGAPFYAARIYAELLRQLGRKEEALDWLVQVHRALPARDPMAMADVVLGRIRELEEELQVPAQQRYAPILPSGH